MGASLFARPLAVAAHPLPSFPFHREAKGRACLDLVWGIRSSSSGPACLPVLFLRAATAVANRGSRGQTRTVSGGRARCDRRAPRAWPAGFDQGAALLAE